VSQEADSHEDKRGNPRTNLLLVATLEAGRSLASVRIRNLSETGALVEGDRLPSSGTAIVLKRGDLEVGGRVAWTAGSRCGLYFDDSIPVRLWVGGKSLTAEPGFASQARVDVIQAEVRRDSGATSRGPAAVEAAAPLAALPARLAEELAYVQRILENIGDELLAEPAVLHRHHTALQGFDLAGQILGHIAAIMVSDDPATAVDRIGMEDLRARLKRKPVMR
jgi:hypothetical protein